MNTLVVILYLLSQTVTDLGVMSPNRVVILEKCTNRADFVHFIVELQATRWPSNYVKFTTTNEVLKMDDFIAMPPGPCVIGLRSLCADSEESPMALFRVDIRRDPPKEPRAHIAFTGSNPSPASLTNAMESMRQFEPIPPPTPDRTNRSEIKPLPNSRKGTYSDSVIEMQRYYAERIQQKNQR